MNAVIVSRPVKPVSLTAECEEPRCNGQELAFYGDVLLSMPAKYVHTCPACFRRYELDREYPTIVYE